MFTRALRDLSQFKVVLTFFIQQAAKTKIGKELLLKLPRLLLVLCHKEHHLIARPIAWTSPSRIYL